MIVLVLILIYTSLTVNYSYLRIIRLTMVLKLQVYLLRSTRSLWFISGELYGYTSLRIKEIDSSNLHVLVGSIEVKSITYLVSSRCGTPAGSLTIYSTTIHATADMFTYILRYNGYVHRWTIQRYSYLILCCNLYYRDITKYQLPGRLLLLAFLRRLVISYLICFD